MEMIARQWCAHHPDRPSLALCMSCRQSICQECSTQWEGINYCIDCVAQLTRQVQGSRPAGFFLMILLSAVFLFAIVRLAVGAGAYLAGAF
jgi:hypothetical protein